MRVEFIAECCHEFNRVLCANQGGDVQPPWGEAPRWQRESAISGVKFIINNPEVTDEEVHMKWMTDKLNDGWKYGEVKDPEAKTHPCLKPYDQLPDDQRLKDSLFRTTVLMLK